jgi:hypothetical protein
MFFCFSPPGDACVQQGGEGGVNIPGTDTAHPADLSGQLRSR